MIPEARRIEILEEWLWKILVDEGTNLGTYNLLSADADPFKGAYDKFLKRGIKITPEEFDAIIRPIIARTFETVKLNDDLSVNYKYRRMTIEHFMPGVKKPQITWRVSVPPNTPKEHICTVLKGKHPDFPDESE